MAVGACGKDETPPPPAKGDGTVKAVATVVSGGTNFRLPFDAALSPDGKTAYFTALVDDGAVLFKSSVTGGTPTKLADLVAPGTVDVTADGSTVLVGDPGAEPSPGVLGAIVAVPTSGGAPSVLTGTEGSLPRGIAISGRRVVFSGVDPADGVPGVFETSASGGLSVVLKAGVIDPSGLTVASSGEVYVLDAESETASTRRIVKVASGSATELVKGLRVGYPAESPWPRTALPGRGEYRPAHWKGPLRTVRPLRYRCRRSGRHDHRELDEPAGSIVPPGPTATLTSTPERTAPEPSSSSTPE
jgi:hypothetical protein